MLFLNEGINGFPVKTEKSISVSNFKNSRLIKNDKASPIKMTAKEVRMTPNFNPAVHIKRIVIHAVQDRITTVCKNRGIEKGFGIFIECPAVFQKMIQDL